MKETIIVNKIETKFKTESVSNFKIKPIFPYYQSRIK